MRKRKEETKPKPLLDLYITHWKEPWEVGRPGLWMLACQRGVNWDEVRVTIVHDGVEPFPESCFSEFPFPVHQECIPHGGPSKARNWGIDHGEAEWIKWNDFDDSFYGVYSVARLMEAIHNAENYDFLWWAMTGEDVEGRVKLRDERDPVLVHAKAFRRSFLREHNVRYNESLTWCEDSAFLALVELEIDHQRIGKVSAEAPLYCSIARVGSLCHRKEIRFQNMKSFFYRHRYVQDEFLKREKMEPYRTMSVRIMGDCYKILFLDDFPGEDLTEYREEVLEYWRMHRGDFFLLPEKRYRMALDAVDNESVFWDEEKKAMVQRKIPRDGEFKSWLREMTEEIHRRGLEFAEPVVLPGEDLPKR